jgi:hypothetical protein
MSALADDLDEDEVEEGDFLGPALPPREPIAHGPGTVERLGALIQRAERGEALFDERDAGEFDAQQSVRLEDTAPCPLPQDRTGGRTARLHGVRLSACRYE